MALSDEAVDIDDPHLMNEAKLAIILGTEGDGLSCERDIQFERRIINEVDTEVLMDAFHLALQCGRPVAGLHGLGIQTDDRGRRGQLKDDCCK